MMWDVDVHNKAPGWLCPLAWCQQMRTHVIKPFLKCSWSRARLRTHIPMSMLTVSWSKPWDLFFCLWCRVILFFGGLFLIRFPILHKTFCIILCIDCSTYVLKSLYCSVECAWWISKYHKTKHDTCAKHKGDKSLLNHVDRNMGTQGVCVCAYVFFSHSNIFWKIQVASDKTLFICCIVGIILPSWHRDYFIRH